MRLPLLAALILLAGTLVEPSASARTRHRARPHAARHCPEFRMEGFCFYDTGWHPARDNPLFSPLRPGDPEGQSGPICWLTDSRDRRLVSWETEAEVPSPALRIHGRLVRFRRASPDDQERFVSDAGELRIDEGAVVAAAHEFDARRATLTFTDRGGRRHVASVRISCAV